MSYPYQITSLEAYHEAYRNSVDDPEGFWGGIAGNFTWHQKWDKVLNWNFKDPKVEWFAGGKLNITENCLDRTWLPSVTSRRSSGNPITRKRNPVLSRIIVCISGSASLPRFSGTTG